MGSDLQHSKKELVALSSAQRNIWFDQIIYPDACGYNIGFFIEFDGEIDPARMGRALNEAVNSLQTMRAVFTTIGDEPYQYVLDECEVPMPLFDVRQATSPKQASNEIINQHIRQPFALTRDLNCRFGLIRLEEQKWIWFGACHHIILDGVGGALLIDALAHAYRHDTSMHPRIPDAWRVALALDEDYLNSADFEADGKYWENELMGLPDPSKLCRQEKKTSGLEFPETVSVQISRPQFERIVDLGKETGGSVYAVFSTAFLIYLSKLTGVTETCIGVPSSGRVKSTRQAAGDFSNTVPLRLSIQPSASIQELVKLAARQVRRGYRHSRYPMSMIARQRRQMRLGAPFSVIVNYENFTYDLDFGEAKGRIHSLNPGPAPDLTLMVVEWQSAGPVEFRMDYNAELYTHQEALAHLERYLHLLDEMCQSPDRAISELTLIDHNERSQVLQMSRGRRVESLNFPPDISQHFLDQAQRHPNRDALICGNKTLSYQQLNARVEGLARILMSQGAGPEKVIGVLLDRSEDLLVALLSILRVGAVLFASGTLVFQNPD